MSSDSGFEVLGYIFLGVLIFAAWFLVLMCHHRGAKRQKRARQTQVSSRNVNVITTSDGNFVPRSDAPIWTTQISMTEQVEGHTHNTLPRIEVRYPRREVRRQSDADILFGNANIFGFTNEGVQIQESTSNHSVESLHDRNRRNQDGLPTYHEALQMPKKDEQM